MEFVVEETIRCQARQLGDAKLRKKSLVHELYVNAQRWLIASNVSYFALSPSHRPEHNCPGSVH